jgi:hypothetical protein
MREKKGGKLEKLPFIHFLPLAITTRKISRCFSHNFSTLLSSAENPFAIHCDENSCQSEAKKENFS